jgi:hypothetical protein
MTKCIQLNGRASIAIDNQEYAPELVVAPVTITPTKPLTPTHVKGLLWADVLMKATASVAAARLVWNPRMSHLTTQTTAFWRHLDEVEPNTDWSAETQLRIGERYVRFHADRSQVDPRKLDSYFARVDEDGWIHPAGRRMLELWRGELDLLGVPDPGLTVDCPLATTTATTLAALAERGMTVDHRRFGGPVYLDGVRWGMPIRQLVGIDGHPNYLLPILRELIPMIRPHRTFLLLFDDGLMSDYLLIERVLTEFGATVARLPLSRVPVDGSARSSRHGGWMGSTLGDLMASCGTSELAAYRLGMRLYFVGMLDRRSPQSFRMDLLHRCISRAARILKRSHSQEGAATAPNLRSLRSMVPTDGGYIDPYRLTVSMLGRDPSPLSPMLRAIYT